MPLPASNIGSWPPADLKPYIDTANQAAAWWTGTETALTDASTTDPTDPSRQTDNRRRRFWDRRRRGDATKATARYHAPLAADIASVSSDLLFGDPVDLTIGDDAAQAQLETLVDQVGLHNLLAEGAETCAAVGGTYLRPAWNEDLVDHPLLQVYDQRHAAPDFTYGRLAAVTLWDDVRVEGATVWRHLERHEPGRILHGLYKGTRTDLGVSAPLTDHPATEGLDPEVMLQGRLRGRLLVEYVPNVLPHRAGRKPIGRPDTAGTESFLDALDETWTSLMRDLRLGQAHVFVPQEWLKATGGRPGQQTQLDLDTEVFTALNVPDVTEQKLDTFQGEIRVDAHIAAALALTERIVSAAGYSPQTFGLQIDGSAQSGTALRIRQGKTDKTTSKKQRYWQPAVERVCGTMLDIGAEIWSTPGVPAGERVHLSWPELHDPAELASTVQTLRTAQALSIEGAVRMVQPDLDETDQAEEVARIRAESAVADPFPMG